MKTSSARCQVSGTLGLLALLVIAFVSAHLVAAATSESPAAPAAQPEKIVGTDTIAYGDVVFKTADEFLESQRASLAKWNAAHPTWLIRELSDTMGPKGPVGMTIVYEERSSKVPPVSVVLLTLSGKHVVIADDEKDFRVALKNHKWKPNEATHVSEAAAWPHLLEIAKAWNSTQAANTEVVAVVKDGLAPYFKCRTVNAVRVILCPTKPLLAASTEQP